MSQTPSSPREKPTLTPVDTSPESVLGARLASLEERLDAVTSGGEVGRYVNVIRVLHALTEEYVGRLTWFVKMGRDARELLTDLSDDYGAQPDDGVPDLGNVLAGVASAGVAERPGDKSVVKTAAVSDTGIPPELASILAKMNITF